MPPMLKQALNALGHGLEHFAQGSAEDRGFAFEHIDQAAELLLKEKVRQLGEPIYRGRHESISIHEAKRKLEGKNVTIPNWSAVEVVREQRDTIHHNGYVPDEDTTTVYLNDVIPFFETFLREQFGIELGDFLASKGVSVPGQPASAAEKLLAEATRTASTHPRMSIMTAATAVELVARPLVKDPVEKAIPLSELGRRLKQSRVWTDEDYNKFQSFLQVRNRAAHGAEDPLRTEATFAVEAARNWVTSLRQVGGTKT